MSGGNIIILQNVFVKFNFYSMILSKQIFFFNIFGAQNNLKYICMQMSLSKTLREATKKVPFFSGLRPYPPPLEGVIGKRNLFFSLKIA